MSNCNKTDQLFLKHQASEENNTSFNCNAKSPFLYEQL